MAFLLLAGKHSWAITWLSGSREIGQGFKIYRKSFMIWKKKKKMQTPLSYSHWKVPRISMCCGTWTFPGERKLRSKWGSMPS